MLPGTFQQKTHHPAFIRQGKRCLRVSLGVWGSRIWTPSFSSCNNEKILYTQLMYFVAYTFFVFFDPFRTLGLPITSGIRHRECNYFASTSYFEAFLVYLIFFMTKRPLLSNKKIGIFKRWHYKPKAVLKQGLYLQYLDRHSLLRKTPGM